MSESIRDAAGNRPAQSGGETIPDTIASARHDVLATRQRMSNTVAEIEERISSTVADAKRKVDVVTLARENPWLALGIAVAAGMALAATGADHKAATATVSVAKRAPDGAKQGASIASRAASAGLSYLMSAAAQRLLRSRRDGGIPHTSGYESPTLMSRLTDRATAPLRAIGDELRSGVDELPKRTAAPPGTGPSAA
jgi:ElaB/YqjD/DUF883 family membrane-anchored ribosome-binding protein